MLLSQMQFRCTSPREPRTFYRSHIATPGPMAPPCLHLLGIQYIQPTLPKVIADFTALIRSTMEDNVYDALVSCLREPRSLPVEDSESAIMTGLPVFRLLSLSQPFIEAVGLNNYVVIILDLTYVIPFSRLAS